jgi:hypothetical protein
MFWPIASWLARIRSSIVRSKDPSRFSSASDSA